MTDDPTSGPTVTVVVLTYRRPEDLVASITLLKAQLDQVPASRLLVVDNDQQPSAENVVRDLTADDARIRYVHEPLPGIAAARNRALRETDTDLLVFIDDDERPSDRWLATMVEAWMSFRVAAVVGPVLSWMEDPVDPWIAAGRYFDRLRHRTGTRVSTAATNNLLLDLDQVRRLGLRFDERFGLSGGSDTVFTRQLVAGGGQIVWCDEAPVYDVVPASRATRDWVKARALRTGNSDTRARVHLAPTPRARAFARTESTLRGVARVTAGGLRAAYGRAVRSTVAEARGTRTMLRGLGMLRGAWGSHIYEYRRSA